MFFTTFRNSSIWGTGQCQCVFMLDMQTGSGRYLLKPYSIQVFLHKQCLLTEKLSSQTSISFVCVNLDNLAMFSGK